MSHKELRRQRSVDAKSASLRACQRSNSSSADMDAEFGSNKLSGNRHPAWSKAVCEIDEQASPRRDQLVNNRRGRNTDGEVHRSTSPLNELLSLSPKKNLKEYIFQEGLNGRSEASLGNSSSSGLLRLSGKQGWTASPWKKGRTKPTALVPDANGSIHISPHPVNSQDGQHIPDIYGAPMTPRGSGDGKERLPKASQGNQASEQYDPARPADRRTTNQHQQQKPAQGGNAKHSKEWISMELERLKSEYQFKSQIATMLRSTLTGMKTQQDTRPQRPPEWHGAANQAQKYPLEESPRAMVDQVHVREWSAPLTEASSGELEAMKSEAKERKKDISHLESHIMTLETHVKLLSDALDDERQENQDLSEENEILKAQVEKLTIAGEKLLKGMAALRGAQE